MYRKGKSCREEKLAILGGGCECTSYGEVSGPPCTEGADAFGGSKKAFGSRETTCGTDERADDGQAQHERSATDEGRKEETRVPSARSPSAQAPLAVDSFGDAPSALADRVGVADLPKAGSPTALDILAGSGAAVAAAEATQLNFRESAGISVATEILNSEDEEKESSLEEQEE
ncbi:hypothetical protein AXG93_2587s1800 [Marchantia polymorpha subsp. ruderalis]|uniref:Uncharacterized protein n=1 Tax=Marchantia polymorpha subsp. ruderalis TaxID=1480154 RepID=A0A176WRJ8_MARPO|nr:hypothetical protein AXG93_2587s1800 [Marchantia polymorpha subsp. ruderalis]